MFLLTDKSSPFTLSRKPCANQYSGLSSGHAYPITALVTPCCLSVPEAFLAEGLQLFFHRKAELVCYMDRGPPFSSEALYCASASGLKNGGDDGSTSISFCLWDKRFPSSPSHGYSLSSPHHSPQGSFGT